jgi:hypothetical protein
MGYGLNKKGYKYFDPINKRLYITMDTTFIESEHFYSPMVSNSVLQEEPRSEDLNWYVTAPTTVSTTDNSVDPATTTVSNPTDPVDDSTTHANGRQLGEPENDVKGIHEY